MSEASGRGPQVSTSMNAAVFTRYGSPDVLEFKALARPTPREDEVLIRVHAVSLNDWDWGALQGDSLVNRMIFGLLKPKLHILGSDVAGRVEAVGQQVVSFRPGDAVFGDLSGRWGGFADYVCAHEKAVLAKAPDMSFEAAAAIPQAGLLALQGLRAMGPMQPGQSLLINGAGGGVGTFALQLAKQHGVTVTAVDRPEKGELLRALGAVHVIDYTQEDFTQNGERYDFILDVKTSRSIFDCVRALKPRGVYVTVGGSTPRLIQALLLGPWFPRVRGQRIHILVLKPNQGLDELKALFETGTVVPVIDGPFAFREIPDAFRRFGEGKHLGKVVITMGQPDAPEAPLGQAGASSLPASIEPEVSLNRHEPMSSPLQGLIQSLDDQRLALLGALDALSVDVLRTRPRPDAWSILEILEHVVVAESVILRGLPPRSGLVAQPRNLGHRLKYVLVTAILRFRIPVKVPSRRMLPTGQASLAELRAAWDAHLAWLRAFVAEDEAAAQRSAFFTHPVAGPITLVQALRMDLLHLGIHQRQIAKLCR